MFQQQKDKKKTFTGQRNQFLVLRHFHQMFLLDLWRKKGLKYPHTGAPKSGTSLKKGNVLTLLGLLKGHDQHDKNKIIILFVCFTIICVCCLLVSRREGYINYTSCSKLSLLLFLSVKKQMWLHHIDLIVKWSNKNIDLQYESPDTKNRGICKKAVEIIIK